VLTGFLFYKGWKKNLFKLRWKSGIKKLWSDLHKLLGVWSLIFALIIALTGVFYFVELIILATDNYDVLLPDGPENIELAERAEFGNNVELLPIDIYVENAETAFPGLEVLSVRVPHTADDYVYADGQAGNPLTRNRANKVFLHPVSGEAVHIQKSSEINAAEWITDAADPIHFGYFGGLPAKILWFLFGLAISFSVLSGTYLWYIRNMEKAERKLKKYEKRQDQSRTFTTIVKSAASFFTMARGAVLSTTVILIYLIITAVGVLQEDGVQSYGPYPSHRTADIDRVDLGPWLVDLSCTYTCNLSKGTVSIEFQSSGIPNYKSAVLKILSNDGDRSELQFGGPAKNPSLGRTDDYSLENLDSAILSITAVDGTIYSQNINIQKITESRDRLAGLFPSPPSRAMPDVPMGVVLFILFFAVCTASVLITWTWLLVKNASVSAKIRM